MYIKGQRSHAFRVDMTEGFIPYLVIVFGLPIVLGNILQALYNTVDTLVIGNFCSKESLAAVGTSAQPVELLLTIFMGIGGGVSILVSQAIGAGKKDLLDRYIATAISFLYLAAVPISILGFFLGPSILHIMQVPEDSFSRAADYVRIVFLATIGNMGYNLNAGILRGMGDSTASLLFLLVSTVINIVLDILFVGPFGMDTAGAALATAIAMLTSWIFSVYYIKRNFRDLHFTLLPRTLNRRALKQIIMVGVPLGLNNSLYSVGHIFMQSLINLQGSTFMAACSVATKLTGLTNVTNTAFSQAAGTFAGQNYGARNKDRVIKGHLLIPLMSAVYTLIAGLITTIFAYPILSLFTKDEDVLYYALRYIQVVMPLFWPYAMLSCIIAYMNGVGEILYPTIINLLMLWGVRIPVGYAITYFYDGTWCMVAFPISFFVGMTLLLYGYRTKRWKRRIEELL